MKWLAVALFVATPALAQERELCPNRPGLGSPPCTVDRGHVLVETALLDWTRDDAPDARTDTILIGDTLVRIGVADAVEVQFAWTPYGHERISDKATGPISRAGRVGDVAIGAKLNLANSDGSGFSIALQPVVTLPVGRTPIGAGDWFAEIAAPLSYDLSDTFSLQATLAIAAAVDGDGDGRHAAYGSVVGLGVALDKSVGATLEFELTRDDDPADATTQALAGLSFAWQPGENLQLDIGAAAGLNRDTPDARIYAGISRRF